MLGVSEVSRPVSATPSQATCRGDCAELDGRASGRGVYPGAFFTRVPSLGGEGRPPPPRANGPGWEVLGTCRDVRPAATAKADRGLPLGCRGRSRVRRSVTTWRALWASINLAIGARGTADTPVIGPKPDLGGARPREPPTGPR